MVGLLCVQIDENVQREIINHRSLRHPNIIRFKEVIQIFFSLISSFGSFTDYQSVKQSN